MNKAQRLANVINKKRRRIVGLMSGMSMDGVDLACVDISGTLPHIEVKILGTHFRSYSKEFQNKLKLGQNGTTASVSMLNFKVAEEFAACFNEFLNSNPHFRGTIDAIGSHGQTLYHATDTGCDVKSTLQVGALSIIADLTGVLTVGNFRVRDISAGGTGAPLVSLADYILFHRPNEVIAMNNLGSISNLTVVSSSLEDMLAFDTGPANMPIDFFASHLKEDFESTELLVDFGGRFSAKGTVIPALLNSLLENSFFCEPPPKAAGYEEFGPAQLALAAEPFASAPVYDLLRTAVEFSAITISRAYRDFVIPKFPNIRRVIFSGGGTRNLTLMKRITELLPELQIETLPKDISDAKEAIAFALLANETLSGRPGNIISVTGAAYPVVLGEIAL
jgi:anhydro-N-acetylmuramic acid kinase